jgi:hypothetical protein
MDDQSLWKIMRESWSKLQACFDPVIKLSVSESELSLREWSVLFSTLTFEPEDTTPSHLMVRGPYTSSEQYLNWLENAADKEYLQIISTSRFRLTSEGRKVALDFIKAAREAMVSADPLPSSESQILSGLLDRLVESCLETPPPPNTWSISLSNKLMPKNDPPMPFIEQAITCISAYRDDAHLASWRSSGLSATALESLTLIWRRQVNTLDELREKLSFRGHPKKVYIDALAELRARSYISGVRSVLRITEDGKLFRDKVETKTDHYFFAPWSSLTQSEKGRLAKIFNIMEKEL